MYITCLNYYLAVPGCKNAKSLLLKNSESPSMTAEIIPI